MHARGQWALSGNGSLGSRESVARVCVVCCTLPACLCVCKAVVTVTNLELLALFPWDYRAFGSTDMADEIR